MAICGLLGFENYNLGSYAPGFINGLAECPGATAGTKYERQLLYFSGTSFSSTTIVTDPNLASTKALQFYQLVATNTGNIASCRYGVNMPLTDNNIDKTGTWVLGVRLITSNRMYTGRNSSLVTDEKTPTRFVIAASDNTEYYIELVMNWSTMLLQVYVNGTLRTSYTYNASTLSDIMIGMWGNDQSGISGAILNGGAYFVIRDGYFAVNVSGEANPITRLGPCRVKAAAVASVSGTQWGVTGGGTDIVSALNTAMPTAVPTSGAQSSPFNDVLTVKFTPPTPESNYSTPVGIQVVAVSTPYSVAAVNMQSQLNSAALKTTVLTNGAISFVESATSTPPSGYSSWSSAALGDVTWKLNSVSK